MKELEDKLNIEYKDFGIIDIKEMHEEIIFANDIEYIDSIIAKIEPLESDEPIIVSKSWKKEYKLIDGYHRLKNKILKNEPVKAIILDNYSISRKNDSLIEFLKTLVGKTIQFTSSTELLVDDKLVLIEENEGCGGCGNGWSSINVLENFIGKNIKVKNVEDKSKEKESDEYELYINDELVAEVNTGWGNGYYGGDFTINLLN